MRNIIKQILREEIEKTANFQEIFSTMWDKMLKQVCLKYTKDINKAEDYCQNGFIKVNRVLPKYDGNGSLEGWVRRVINNNILDELRKENRGLQFSSEEPDWSRVDMVNDEPYEENYNIAMVEDVLPELSPGYRKVFELFHFKGYDHKEIADKLGINIGTSKSNLNKARKKVRELISKKFNV